MGNSEIEQTVMNVVKIVLPFLCELMEKRTIHWQSEKNSPNQETSYLESATKWWKFYSVNEIHLKYSSLIS